MRRRRPAPLDPKGSAKAAGLRYVSDNLPGTRRQRCGGGFRYIDRNGAAIRDPEEIRRIKALAIPPAWRDVWICALPHGHLQAAGRDQRGRKQYRYHARWHEVRDEVKYGQMIAFGRALPRIRAQVNHDLGLPGLPRAKMLAAVVRLLETTLIRVGNEEYARENQSFGLTTLREHHVAISGTTIRFQFRGKSGIEHSISINDRRVARILRRAIDLPGEELFQYLDENGERKSIESADVNNYLREVTGCDFSAKDFRTWAGTVLAAQALQQFPAFTSKTQAKRTITAAIATVAARLGNTKAVCRRCYVHPEVINAYLDSSLILGDYSEQSYNGLYPEEIAVLRFLEQRGVNGYQSFSPRTRKSAQTG